MRTLINFILQLKKKIKFIMLAVGEKPRKFSRSKNERAKSNSDRGNRTPGCRVRDGDVNHYTISEWADELCL